MARKGTYAAGKRARRRQSERGEQATPTVPDIADSGYNGLIAIRATAQALRKQWNVPDVAKAEIVRKMVAVATGDAGDRNAVAAAKVVAMVDNLDRLRERDMAEASLDSARLQLQAISVAAHDPATREALLRLASAQTPSDVAADATAQTDKP